MITKNLLQKNINSYITCKKSTWMLYNILEYNDIDLLILLLGLMFLDNDYHVAAKQPYTFEDFKNCLYDTGNLISEEQGVDGFSSHTELELETETVRIFTLFIQLDKNIPALIEAFPKYTKDELKQYEYIMKVDNYLDILKKFFNFYNAQIPYIVLYKGETGKVHCEEYDPTEEEKTSNWKAIPNNQAK